MMASRKVKLIKRILKWIGWLLGLWLLIGVAVMGWGIYREPIAKQEAKDFCANITPGQSIEGIQEHAIASGASKAFAKWTTDQDGIQVMHVIYVGIPPFSRHTCTIKARTSVVSGEYSHMD
jgi:hypothetical protein